LGGQIKIFEKFERSIYNFLGSNWKFWKFWGPNCKIWKII